VQILDGNVAYVDISSFWRLDEAQTQIGWAMRLIADADAVIFDMRRNSGGSPDTVALVVGHLFDESVPLFTTTPRYGEPTTYNTQRIESANGRRPVYVLTSAATFSAGEGFAHLLQERRRAEVVGEVTAGAANPGRPYPVNALFEVVVPNGRLLSAGGTNWEGTGVTPDIAVPAARALEAAHQRALQRLGR
jgi:C-terminal processing protease CtpA/Prc